MNGLPYLDDPAERTRLAWTRSAIAFAGIGIVIARQVPPWRHRTDVADGIAVLAMALAVALAGAGYRLQARRGGPTSARALAAIAVGTAGVGLAALLLAIGAGPA